MQLTFAKVSYDAAVFAATTLEVLHLEQKFGWTITAHQQQASYQSTYWCSVEGLTLGAGGPGSSVLGHGLTLAESLQDLARRLSGKEVTVYNRLETTTHQLPTLTHTLPISL